MADKGKKRKNPRLKKSADYSVFITVLILAAFGVVMVFSASFYTGLTQDNDAYFYAKKQLIGVAAGFVAMLVTMNFDYHNYAKLRWVIFALAILINLAVWIPGLGLNINGAQRWIRLPVIGSFQPSEAAKAGLVVFMASELALRSKCQDDWKGFVYALLMGAFIMLPVLLQNSLSITIVLGVTLLILMFVAGAKLRYFAIPIIPVAAVGGLAFFTEAGAFRIRRLLAFLDPWADPLDTGYQLVQSLYSLGSGGLFGLGLGQSRQKYLFLPYSESDFIFAVVAEELGWIGAIALLAVFGYLIYRCICIAINAADKMGTLLVSGIAGVIAVQVMMHVLVVAGGMPPTGVPMPFISAGSSAIVIFMAEMGIVLNVSRYATGTFNFRRKKKEETAETVE